MLRQTLQLMAGTAVVLPGIAIATAHPVVWTTPEAHAGVHLAGDVFIERFAPAPGGRIARILERADTLHAGDRVVFVVSWSGGDPAGFTMTNPVPRSIVWQPGGSGLTEQVSVDGGHTWGALNRLMMRDGDGWRQAVAEDVTHMRWRVPGRAGQIVYRGVVRAIPDDQARTPSNHAGVL